MAGRRWAARAGGAEAQVEAAARFKMWSALRTLSCSICCFDSRDVVRKEKIVTAQASDASHLAVRVRQIRVGSHNPASSYAASA